MCCLAFQERTRAMLLQQLVSDLITKNDNYMEDGMVRISFASLL